MKKICLLLMLVTIILWGATGMTSESPPSGGPAKITGPTDILIVSGTITNLQGKPIKEVALHFYLNGQKVELEEEVATSKAGVYEAKLKVPKGTFPGDKVELEAAKPSYQPSGRMHLDKVVQERVDEKGNKI